MNDDIWLMPKKVVINIVNIKDIAVDKQSIQYLLYHIFVLFFNINDNLINV